MIDWPACENCMIYEQHPENIKDHPDMCYQFCGMCGRPLTEKGWQIFLNRLAYCMKPEE